MNATGSRPFPAFQQRRAADQCGERDPRMGRRRLESSGTSGSERTAPTPEPGTRTRGSDEARRPPPTITRGRPPLTLRLRLWGGSALEDA